MKIRFYRTGELRGSTFVKIPLRSNALLKFKNDDRFCFIWSKLTNLRPFKNDQLIRLSTYRQDFEELNIEGFDFTNGFKCSDVQRFENLGILSINIYEINFCQDKNIWNYILIPIEISKDDSDRVVDLLVYKNHSALIKQLNMSLDDHHKKFICRRCLNSYTSENMLKIHTPKCETDNITTIGTSRDFHLPWKNHFHKNSTHLRIIADFEIDNEIEDSKAVCNNTTIVFKQNLMMNGYNIVSELEDVSQKV